MVESMKKMIAARELTTGEQQQLVKNQAKQRRQMRFKDRSNGEQRIRPIIKRSDQPIEDEDLAGIDLRRVKYLIDLTDLDYTS